MFQAFQCSGSSVFRQFSVSGNQCSGSLMFRQFSVSRQISVSDSVGSPTVMVFWIFFMDSVGSGKSLIARLSELWPSISGSQE